MAGAKSRSYHGNQGTEDTREKRILAKMTDQNQYVWGYSEDSLLEKRP